MPADALSKSWEIVVTRRLFEELQTAAKGNHADRITRIKGQFLILAKDAIQGNNDKLLSAIIYFERKFLVDNLGNNNLAQVSLFFELDTNFLQELATMYKQGWHETFIPFLFKHNTINICNNLNNADPNKPNFVELRAAVYRQLEQHIEGDEFSLLDVDASVARIFNLLEVAVNTSNNFTIKNLEKSIIPFVVEDILVHNKVDTMAAFIYGYVTLLQTTHNSKQHAILFKVLDIDADSFPIAMNIFDKKFQPSLAWFIVNYNVLLLQIASVNNISHEQFLSFKDNLSAKICAKLGKATLLRDFNKLLDEIFSSIQRTQHVTPTNIAASAEVIAHLCDSIQHLDVERFVMQVKLIIQKGIEGYNAGCILALCQIFEEDADSLNDINLLLAKGAIGQLAWSFINETLLIHKVANELCNIPFTKYVAFKQKVYARLSEILASPVLPDLTTLEHQFSFIDNGQAHNSEELRFITMQLEVLLREAYLQKDSKMFASLIKLAVRFVNTAYKKDANTTIMYLLKPHRTFQTIELFNALASQDNSQSLSKILIDIYVADIDSYYRICLQKRVLPTAINSLYEIQLNSHHQNQEVQSDYFRNPISFQADIYTACGLPNKTENLGKLPFRDGFFWEPMPFLKYVQQTDSLYFFSEPDKKLITDVEEYIATTEQLLLGNDFTALNKQRILRRQLLSIALFKDDPTLFANIIFADAYFSYLAKINKRLAQIQVLLNLKFCQLQKYVELLYDNNLARSVLLQYLAAMPDLECDSIAYLSADNKYIWGCEILTAERITNFRRRVDDILIKQDEQSLVTQHCEQLLTKVAQVIGSKVNIAAWLMITEEIIAFMQGLTLLKDSNVAAQQGANFIFAFIKIAMTAYQQRNYKVVVLLNTFIKLDFAEINMLFASKHYKLLAWYILNSPTLWVQFSLNNKYMTNSQLDLLKKHIIVELKKYYNVPADRDFLRQIGDFQLTDFQTKDFVQLRLLQMEIASNLIIQIQNTNVANFVKIIVDAIEIQKQINGEFPVTAQYLLGVPGDLTVEYDYCLANNEYVLLARLLYQQLLREYNSILIDVNKEELLQFSQAAFCLIAQRYSAFPSLLNNYKSAQKSYQDLLSATSDKLLIEPKAMEHLHMQQVAIQRTLLDAYEFNDVKTYAAWVKLQIDFAIKLYQQGNQVALFKVLTVSHEDSRQVIGLLATRHHKALQRWFINHSITSGAQNTWKFILHKDAHMCYLTSTFKLSPTFVEGVYRELGIELMDALLEDNISLTQPSAEHVDLQAIIHSIRRLANTGINLKQYEDVLALLGKLYSFNQQLQLEENKPNAEDSPQYHEIHQILQAIWHSHIVGHVVSVIKPDVHFGDFELRWEGSMGNAMVKIMQDMYKSLSYSTYSVAEIVRDFSKQFPRTSFFIGKEQFFTALGTEIKAIFLELKETDLQNRLRDGGIIAIPVFLSCVELDTEHAVSALFWRDMVVFSDRGVEAVDEFSGVRIYRIGCSSLAKETVINILINSNEKPIDNEYYKVLKEQLKLNLIHGIPMLQQLRGNCGHASCAEPLHLAITIFQTLSLIITKQKREPNKTTLKLACTIAQRIHTFMMRRQQFMAVKDLLELFTKPDCCIRPPCEFLAHTYVTSLFHVRHKLMAKILQETGYFAINNCKQVYTDYIQYAESFLLLHEIPVENRSAIRPELLHTEAENLVKAYFTGNNTLLNNVVEHSVTALVNGISGQALKRCWAIERPIDLIDTKQQLSLFSVVDQQLLKNIITTAFQNKLINKILWQEIRQGVYFPVTLDLNVTAEEFWQFVKQYLQTSKNLKAKGFLTLFSSIAGRSMVMEQNRAIGDVSILQRQRSIRKQFNG